MVACAVAVLCLQPGPFSRRPSIFTSPCKTRDFAKYRGFRGNSVKGSCSLKPDMSSSPSWCQWLAAIPCSASDAADSPWLCKREHLRFFPHSSPTAGLFSSKHATRSLHFRLLGMWRTSGSTCRAARPMVTTGRVCLQSAPFAAQSRLLVKAVTGNSALHCSSISEHMRAWAKTIWIASTWLPASAPAALAGKQHSHSA